jgi:hypothetical protein
MPTPIRRSDPFLMILEAMGVRSSPIQVMAEHEEMANLLAHACPDQRPDRAG